MFKFIVRGIYLLLLFIVVFSCRGVVGLIDTPEGVANYFITNLYRLNFQEIPKVARDQALLQAALMEGMVDSFSEEERNRYATSDILVISFEQLDDQRAVARYQIVFQDAKQLSNTIYIENKENRWQVVRFEEPIVNPKIYTYLEA